VTALGEKGRELTQTNPWWRTATGWERRDPDLRQAAASGLDYHPDALADLAAGGLYLLRGPRRVGKTVTTKQAISHLIRAGVPPLAIVRVAADGWTAKDLRTVVQNVALPPLAEGQTRYWFMDEVTAATGEWATQIKWLRDNDPAFGDATVVLTGSNATKLSEAAGVLAGRRGRASNVDRTLLPMGFRTFASLWHPDVRALPTLALADLHTPHAAAAYTAALPWLDDLVRLWEIYLLYGGFPVSVAAAKAGQPVPGWFVDALFDVIHRDAFSASSLDASQASSLLSRLWQSTSTPVNLNSIAEQVGVSQPTVARHVQYLRDAYLLWRCPQLDTEWTPRDRAQDKLYPIDPLITRLPHLRRPTRDDLDPTILAEAQIGTALRRTALRERSTWDDDSALFYLRTAKRKEIDFVGADLGGAAVEGKYTDSGGWKSEAQTVQASTYRGILTTRSVLDVSGQGAWAVPAAIFAALIDT
jgi:predicted AAA+ superfamily ATPase